MPDAAVPHYEEKDFERTFTRSIIIRTMYISEKRWFRAVIVYVFALDIITSFNPPEALVMTPFLPP